jgi:hypothetical protein
MEFIGVEIRGSGVSSVFVCTPVVLPSLFDVISRGSPVEYILSFSRPLAD